VTLLHHQQRLLAALPVLVCLLALLLGSFYGV
jgi:hypothetical protein